MDAPECFEKALRIFSGIKTEAARARARRSFAHYENSRGNSAAARKMLAEAREILTRLEIPIKLERA